MLNRSSQIHCNGDIFIGLSTICTVPFLFSVTFTDIKPGIELLCVLNFEDGDKNVHIWFQCARTNWTIIALFITCLYLHPCNISMISSYITVMMASQITGISIVYLTICSGADQRKHQSSTSLAFKRNPPVTRGFPSQRTSNTENVSIWWWHHVQYNPVYPVKLQQSPPIR